MGLYICWPKWLADSGSVYTAKKTTTNKQTKTKQKSYEWHDKNAGNILVEVCHKHEEQFPLTLSLPSSKSTFSQPFKDKCISDVVRIGNVIFHLSKQLWKAKFFILCDVIFWWGCRKNLKLITLVSERVKNCVRQQELTFQAIALKFSMFATYDNHSRINDVVAIHVCVLFWRPLLCPVHRGCDCLKNEPSNVSAFSRGASVFVFGLWTWFFFFTPSG